MTLGWWLVFVLVVAVLPWLTVLTVILLLLHHATLVGARIDAVVTPSVSPCPLCRTGDGVLVDSDGVALCPVCRCSFELVTL